MLCSLSGDKGVCLRVCVCLFVFVRWLTELWAFACSGVLCRCQTGAVAHFRWGMLAADGGLLERRPFPEASARHRGAQSAEHRGPALQLWLRSEKQQPGGLKLKNTPRREHSNAIVMRKVFLLYLWRLEHFWSTGDQWVYVHDDVLVHKCRLYIIYEELKSVHEYVRTFYCLCFVYLYTNSSLHYASLLAAVLIATGS